MSDERLRKALLKIDNEIADIMENVRQKNTSIALLEAECLSQATIIDKLESKLAALEVTMGRVKWWQSLNKMLVCYQSHIEHRTKLDSLLSAVPEVIAVAEDKTHCVICGRIDTVSGHCPQCEHGEMAPATITVSRKEKP